MNFAKYEGAGNDFILIDARNNAFIPESKMIASLCDRHFGIGADGLMTLTTSHTHHCTMRYYNADGSQGEMCGNGGRCFSLFANHLGIGDKTLNFEALDGSHTAQLIATGPFRGSIKLGMIDVKQIEKGDGWWFLNTGVPHYVEFTDSIESIDIERRGRTIRHDTTRFPQGTNVNFVQIMEPGLIRIRTYERGVEAETLACGTGATAAAIITHLAYQSEVCAFDVQAPGGTLHITFEHDSHTNFYQNIHLTGEARRLFQGVVDTENFKI